MRKVSKTLTTDAVKTQFRPLSQAGWTIATAFST